MHSGRFFRRHKKDRFSILTEWREDLSDFEIDLLLPELHARMELLLEYFQSLIAICQQLKEDPGWARAVDTLINPNNGPSADGTVAKTYAESLEPQIEESFIHRTQKVIDLLGRVEDFHSLGKALNEVNLLCESITGVKDKLFRLWFRSVPVVVNTHTGVQVVEPPYELELIILPFKQILDQLVLVASSTADSIRAWRDNELESRRRFFEIENSNVNLQNSRVHLWVNLATTAVAVALSSFFLLAADPFSLVRNNTRLQAQLSDVELELRHAVESLQQCSTAEVKEERQGPPWRVNAP